MSNINSTNNIELISKIRQWREGTKSKLIKQFDQQKSLFVQQVQVKGNIPIIKMCMSQEKIWGLFALALRFSKLKNAFFFNSPNLYVIDFLYKILNDDPCINFSAIILPQEILCHEDELSLNHKLLLILSFLLESQNIIHKFNFDKKFLANNISYYMFEILKFRDIKIFKHSVNLSPLQYLEPADLFNILNNTHIETIRIFVENIDPKMDKNIIDKYFANIKFALSNSSVKNFELHFSDRIKCMDKILNITNSYQTNNKLENESLPANLIVDGYNFNKHMLKKRKFSNEIISNNNNNDNSQQLINKIPFSEPIKTLFSKKKVRFTDMTNDIINPHKFTKKVRFTDMTKDFISPGSKIN